MRTNAHKHVAACPQLRRASPEGTTSAEPSSFPISATSLAHGLEENTAVPPLPAWVAAAAVFLTHGAQMQ